MTAASVNAQPISQLPAIPSVVATDLVAVVRLGTPNVTYRAAVSQLGGGISGGTINNPTFPTGFLSNNATIDVRVKGALCDGVTDDSPAFTAAIAALPNGGIVVVPATGHSCVLKEGITLSSGGSSGQNGVSLEGVSGMYWPGAYDNIESDWTKYGSWIRCDDTVNSCFSVVGSGSHIRGISVWYTQPTPPSNAACSVSSCTVTHNWVPTTYPYTITVSDPENFNSLSDVNIINATNCIDIEGLSTAGSIDTTKFYMHNMNLGCFNIGTRFNLVNTIVDIQNASYRIWWYSGSSDVLGYTEGDAAHNGNKIDWDMNYDEALRANGVDFEQSRAAIRATDATVGTRTLAAEGMQLSDINFNDVCQAVVLTSTTAHFSGRISNVIMNIDPQTSGVSGQCGQEWPYAFSLNSDNVDLSLEAFTSLQSQSVAIVGGGNSGTLRMPGSPRAFYSFYTTGSPAFQLSAGSSLSAPDVEGIVPIGTTSGPVISGVNSWYAVNPSNQIIAGPSGTGRAQFLSTSSNNGGIPKSRWAILADNSPEAGSNSGSNFQLARYNDDGSFADLPIGINRSTGFVNIPDALSTSNVYVTGASGTNRDYFYQTSGVPRWVMYANAGPESGGNVGTDFGIQRYSDAGAVLDTPLSISRASGLVSLADAFVVQGATTINGSIAFNSSFTANQPAQFKGLLIALSLPLSCSGVPTGTLWQSSGTVHICP